MSAKSKRWPPETCKSDKKQKKKGRSACQVPWRKHLNPKVRREKLLSQNASLRGKSL